MTTPPPSEIGPSAEEIAAEIGNAILQACDEHGPLAPRYAAEIIRAILDRWETRLRRSAHLEDARAGCPECSGMRPTPAEPEHDGANWIHVYPGGSWSNCERPEVWDALSLPPGGQK